MPTLRATRAGASDGSVTHAVFSLLGGSTQNQNQRSQSTTPVPVQLGTTQSVQQLYRYGTTRCSDLGTVLYRTDIAANVVEEEERGGGGSAVKIVPLNK
jgi:hypothetical protein